MSRTLLLFGPSGGTGRLVLSQAIARGWQVRGAEPDGPQDLCDHPAFQMRKHDLLNDAPGDLFEGVDAVISAIGLGRDPQTLVNPPPLYTDGTRNICIGMRRAGVRRLVVTSAAFAAKSVTLPAWFEAALLPLGRIFEQMADMETLLATERDIDWTAARPGWLLDLPHSGQFLVADDDLPTGTLRTRRADLAHFMLDCATNGAHVGKAPFVAAPEATKLESPSALLEEVLPS